MPIRKFRAQHYCAWGKQASVSSQEKRREEKRIYIDSYSGDWNDLSADMVKAKHNISYYVGGAGGKPNFDRKQAEKRTAKNRLIIEPGEEIPIR